MIEIHPALQMQLNGLGGKIDIMDADTVILRNLPTNRHYYNKPRVNLLLKRSRQGCPFIVGVDEDLVYGGKDMALSRAFAGGMRREGWRILACTQAGQTGLENIIEGALSMLGCDGREPDLTFNKTTEARSSTGGGLLEAFGAGLTEKIQSGDAPPTVGNVQAIERAAACLLRWGQTRMPVISGESGVGKSNLLYGIAARLLQCRPELSVKAVDMGVLLAGTLFHSDRENLIAQLLKECAAEPHTIVALEGFDLAVTEVVHGPAMISRALDQGVMLIGTTTRPQSLTPEPVLERRTEVIELAEPSTAETLEILTALCAPISAHHRIAIDSIIARKCVGLAETLPGCFPAKAIHLLDNAAARASLSGASAIGPEDLAE